MRNGISLHFRFPKRPKSLYKPAKCTTLSDVTVTHCPRAAEDDLRGRKVVLLHYPVGALSLPGADKFVCQVPSEERFVLK